MAQEEKQFGLTKDEQNELIVQCQNEIITSETFMQPKWEKWRRRLRLLNNQKKRDSDISEPLAHVHFNTMHAALYNDELKTTFLPREKGDITVTENLNPLYEYDSELMDKRVMDYEWIWNTLFFGRSLVMMFEFDRKNKVPKPEVVNMLTWYRDPNALSVNGDSAGRGAMRFGGRPFLATIQELEDAGVYENLNDVLMSSSENQILEAARDRVRSAQGFDTSLSDDVIGENRVTTIMEWLTIYKGKRVIVGLANGKTLLVRYQVLKDQDEWGIIDQTMYPNGLSWDGVSVLDLIEDKQRAKAKLINAALFTVETNGNHMYAYDANRINNESDLDFEFNKHIPINGDPSGAIQPISRSQVNNEVQFMLDYIDASAQKSTGATEIQQGASTGAKKTATEIATVQESVDTRFQLLSKVIGWSEKNFARYWYKMYKMHFKDTIDEKIMRIVGMNGVTFKSFTRENLVAEVDPDVTVKSKIVGEAKRIREIQEFNSMFEILAQDPNVNVDELVRNRAKLGGMTEMQMASVFRPDPERILATEENEKLNANEFVKINPTDDDLKHIQEHEKAAQNAKTMAHQKAHWKAYLAKNKNPNVRQEVAELNALQNPPLNPELPQETLQPINTLRTA